MPELLEPMIIICGGGLEKANVDKGRIATAKFIRLVVREYTSQSRRQGWRAMPGAATSRP